MISHQGVFSISMQDMFSMGQKIQCIFRMRHRDLPYLEEEQQAQSTSAFSDSIQGLVLYVSQMPWLPIETVVFKYMFSHFLFYIVCGKGYSVLSLAILLLFQHMVHLKYMVQVSMAVGIDHCPADRAEGTWLCLCQPTERHSQRLSQ